MTRRTVVKVAVAAAVLACLGLAAASQWNTVRDQDLHVQPGWLGLAFVAVLAGQVLQGELTLQILRALGAPIPAPAGRRIFGAAVLARYVPTGSLVFILRVQMNTAQGVPRLTTLFAMLCELALAVAAATILAVPVLLDLQALAAIGVIVLGAAALAVVLPGPQQRLARWALARAGRPAAGGALPPVTAFWLLAAFLLAHLLAGVGLLCAARAATRADLDLVRIVSSYGLGFVTSILGFALPGGLGAREAGIVAGLAGSLGGRLALVVAALSRLVQTVVELTYAAVSRVRRRPPAATAPPAAPRR